VIIDDDDEVVIIEEDKEQKEEPQPQPRPRSLPSVAELLRPAVRVLMGISFFCERIS